MPGREAHLAQARRNAALAETLKQTEYGEWVVTLLFYVAIHYIEAALDVYGYHCDDHSQRLGKIATIPQLRVISGEYNALKLISRQARYHAQPIQPEDIARAEHNLSVIRAHIKMVFFPTL